MAEIQVPQLPTIEELGGYLLYLVSVQVKAFQVGEVANLHGDVGDMIVPQLKACETV